LDGKAAKDPAVKKDAAGGGRSRLDRMRRAGTNVAYINVAWRPTGIVLLQGSSRADFFRRSGPISSSLFITSKSSGRVRLRRLVGPNTGG